MRSRRVFSSPIVRMNVVNADGPPMPFKSTFAAALSLETTIAAHRSRTVIDETPALSFAATSGDVGSRSSVEIASACSSVNAFLSTCQSSAAASMTLKVEAIA